ncbi:hypothetical protein D3C72_849330 [compost metagenome]
MKKIFITATGTLALFASVIFHSCQKDEANSKPKKTVLMSASEEYKELFSLLLKLGFSDAATVDISNETAIKNQLEIAGVDLSPYRVSDAVKLTFLDESEGTETGYILLGQGKNGNYDKFLSVKLELVTGDVQYVKGNFNNDVNGNPISVNTETHNIDGASGTDIVTLGEKDLGPRRNGETFNDCFSRNWTNFATDIPSALSQATMPHLIAAAIAIDCAPKAKAK